MAPTIKSLEVPVLQTDIPNLDWFCFMSTFGWPQSRPAEELKVQINILEAWYGIFSPEHSPELDYRSEPKQKDLNSIPVWRWLYDSYGDASHYPKPTQCYEANTLEPREFLKIKEEKGPKMWQSVIHAHMLGCTTNQQGSGEQELEYRFVLNVDFQLFTENCISNLEYDNVVCGSTETIYDVLEEKSITCHSWSSIEDILDKALFRFELPLFCDNFLSMSSACIYSLTCSDEVNGAGIPLESPLEGLNAKCFDTLIVMPELRIDDEQFQSVPIPVLADWSSEGLQLATATSASLNCRQSPMTATDWLYLDWHFAHGRTCNTAECFKLHAKLEHNNTPTIGITSIRANGFTDWLKIAFKLVGLESAQGRSIISTCEHNTKDYDEPMFAHEQASVINQDRRDPYSRHCQTASTREAGKRTDCDLSTKKKEKLETMCMGVPVGRVDSFPEDSPSTQRVQRNQHTLQSFEKNDAAAGPTVAEECMFKLPVMQDAQGSNGNRPSPGSETAVDHLTCFLQARKGLPQNNCSYDLSADCEEMTREIANIIPTAPPAEISSVESGDKTFSSFEHALELSVEIQSLISTLALDYHRLIVAKDILGEKRVHELELPGKFGFDSWGNTRIMILITKIASQQPTQQRQVLLRGLTALHVLRHTALNLCTYGIQVAHLYLENLFDRIRYLEELILTSRVELEYAYNKVERGTYQDHPKLHHLEKLLKGRNSAQKILLIADRRAFFTLYKKLLSSGFSPYQIDRKEQYLKSGLLLPYIAMELKDDITHALSFSNCLLVPYAYITDSFPIEDFTLIIQYACSGTDAAMEEVLKRGRCERHIFKDRVNPEEVNPLTAHETSQVHANDTLRIKQEQDRQYDKILRLLEPTNHSADPPRIEGITPSKVNGQTPMGTHDATACDMLRVRTMPTTSLSSDGCVTEDYVRSTDENLFTQTGYEMILVANISQRGHKLTERRSSYQKILCLEKQNIQVVERELRLPVDLLLSPAVCLVIYTRPMLEQLPQSLEHEQSLLRTEIDIILKAISFAYRDCILIFEGPADFTAAVLDVLCEVHATAIWLELEVQCFISDGVGITDKIVMKCVEAARQSKLLEFYPAMTETPTIAEAFLTEFPTINPLTAHAVLSSGCPLRTFFSLSHEQQYALVQDSGVPKHSLELFKAQCTYREVGNSLHSGHLHFGSPSNHHMSKLDCQKDVASSNSKRIISPGNFAGVKEFRAEEQREDDTEIGIHMSVREPTFPSWSSYPDMPTIFEVEGDSQVGNSRKTVSFVEAECFPEFPPACELTGDLKLKDTRIEVRRDDSTPEFNHSCEDDEFVLPEGESNRAHDDYLPYLRSKSFYCAEDETFLASLDKLKASLNSWDDNRREREDCNNDMHRKIQQSYRSFDCSNAAAPGSLGSSGKCYRKSDGMEVQDVTQLSSILTVPYRDKSSCKGKLLQTSLDRYRDQPKDSRASGIFQTSLKFPRLYPRKKERPMPTLRSPVSNGYVPVDKRPKKLLGLTRRGSDRQQRLIWLNRNNEVHDVSKRQKKDLTYST